MWQRPLSQSRYASSFGLLVSFSVWTCALASCGKAPPREAEPEPRSKVVFPDRPGAEGAEAVATEAQHGRRGADTSDSAALPGESSPGSGREDPPDPRLASPGGPPRGADAQDSAPALRAPEPALDPAIQADVAAMAATLEMSGVELGIAVVDLASGAVIAESNGARALNPASNEKLATTATALVRLGPDHRFESTLELVGADLVLRGNGNPTLTTASLQTLVDTAKAALGKKGYKDVIVDESGFSGAALPPGFGKKLTDAAYRAATGMTVVDEGTFKIEILPTRVGEPVAWQLTPPGDYFTIDNRGKMVAGKKGRIGVETALEPNRTRLVIRGKLGVDSKTKPITVRRVEHPSLAAASALHAILRRAGIRLSGTARAVNTRPAAGQVLASVTSPPLSEIVTRVNKESNNFLAEMLLRALALKGRQGAAPIAVPAVAPNVAVPAVAPNVAVPAVAPNV
ncbi:MAG: D-alanyl-D-alanine carboxypeptidase/D-alanyl-D-alanine-endopeptidase, partial [Myxococcales bacterium]|nr:D-alanyl-D-alanine carboxypeptidase/D-alanyl-D-alanine-endopeptidase [Myxococcales bacterium]